MGLRKDKIQKQASKEEAEPERSAYIPARRHKRDPQEKTVSVFLSNWRNPDLKREFDAYLKRHEITATEWVRWKAEESIRKDESPPSLESGPGEAS